MSHSSAQPGTAAYDETTQQSPTLPRPTHGDEVQTLLAGFTARRPVQSVTLALRNISAICTRLHISQDRIVIDWLKTVTGLIKGDTNGQ